MYISVCAVEHLELQQPLRWTMYFITHIDTVIKLIVPNTATLVETSWGLGHQIKAVSFDGHALEDGGIPVLFFWKKNQALTLISVPVVWSDVHMYHSLHMSYTQAMDTNWLFHIEDKFLWHALLIHVCLIAVNANVVCTIKKQSEIWVKYEV